MARLFSFLIIFFFLSTAQAVVDLGDGSDGVCNFSGAIASGTYNCTTLTIAVPTTVTSGTSALIIKVQGAVNISSSLTLTVNNGLNSIIGSATDVAGGAGLAGGASGGNYIGATSAAQDGVETVLGSGGSAGTGDDLGDGVNNKGSGGGGGAGHGTAGAIGIDGNFGLGGNGGASNSSDLSSTLVGGSGGGSSGPAVDTAFLTYTGATGGAGGGAVRITAGSTMIITGSISAVGGNGGNGNTQSGGGGAGSGGTIHLQSIGAMTISGTFDVLGGTGGTGAGNGGNGGNGGVGRIFLETLDGAAGVDLTGSTITPGVSVEYGVLTVSGLSTLSEYEGKIVTSCGSLDKNSNPWNFIFIILFGFYMIFLFQFLSKRVLHS